VRLGRARRDGMSARGGEVVGVIIRLEGGRLARIILDWIWVNGRFLPCPHHVQWC
jgi:hypothetical protein